MEAKKKDENVLLVRILLFRKEEAFFHNCFETEEKTSEDRHFSFFLHAGFTRLWLVDNSDNSIKADELTTIRWNFCFEGLLWSIQSNQLFSVIYKIFFCKTDD